MKKLKRNWAATQMNLFVMIGKMSFVGETKSNGQELKGSENMKVNCGKKVFREFKDVNFEQVCKVEELR